MSAGPFSQCAGCGRAPGACICDGALMVALHQCPGCRSTLAGAEPCVTCHGAPDRALIALGHRLLAAAHRLLAPAGARRW